LGDYFLNKLCTLDSPLIREVRGKGLLLGVEIDPRQCSARHLCQALAADGILTRETHETVIRFAPPLVITRAQIDWAAERIAETFAAATPLLQAAGN
ncbi:MAG TPA: aminotransferase class III-fold pyridoxal phosphate-dependent enzyme, partial [Gammaproteobacteria bacterium]|nr:aminotransferase class III-fold pyridoxal phosphate-dependent enzyme [Gammaproteobacteria bacterium]